MDFLDPQGLVFQYFDPHLKRCGCYVRRPDLIVYAQPRTHLAMPLKHIDYNIQVTNGLASITLQQKYLNPTDFFLEIDFSFPIDPKSCIYKFVAEFGSKRIEGIVKEKEQARREYKEAISQGKQAVFAEIDPNSEDIMNMEIGNLGPGEKVTISISYLHQLNVEQNTFYQLHIPSTVSPRYANNNPGKVWAQNVTTLQGEYTWTFKISLLTSRKLVYYISPSHNLSLLSQNENSTETILCLAKQEKPSIDLFLLFTVQNFHLPNYILGRTDVSSTAMLSFIPKFCELTLDDAMQASMIKKQFETDMSAAKGEYIFLLDRSASMGGSRIQKAKQALTLFLQSLPEDTYFNVVSFGSRFKFMFDDSIKYDNKNLKTAVNNIKKMSADMGGTQIFGPLNKILKNKVIAGYPKQIFLLTDGGVQNTERVIAMVGKQVKYSRCHSIGIGNGCSQGLIKGSAQKGKGKYILIQDSENPSQKIIGLLEQTLTPVIDHVNLKYNKNLVQSIVPNPDSLPYILKNEVVNFYITFKGQLDQKTTFNFGYKDSLNKVPFQTNIEVDPQSTSISFIDKMAHSRVIKSLQSAAKDSKPVEDYMYYVRVTDKKQEAIKQSVKHQILSQYTAFICVNKELVDGKFEEIKDKGTEKVEIQPIIHYNFAEREQTIRQLLLETKNSQQRAINAINCNKSSVKKKSLGGFFSNVVDSISSGVSNLFSKNQSSQAQRQPTSNMAEIQKRQETQNMAEIQKSEPMRQNNLKMSRAQTNTYFRNSNLQKSVTQSNIGLFGESNHMHGMFGESKMAMPPGNSPMFINPSMISPSYIPTKKPQIIDLPQCANNSSSQDSDDQRRNLMMKMEECSKEINFDISKNVLIDECAFVPEWKQQEKEISSTNQQQVIFKSKNIPFKSIQSTKNVPIQTVIQQQDSDGSFSSLDLLKSLFPHNFDQIIKDSQSENIAVAIAITYTVAKWIEKNHPSKQYGLIVKKAFSFIKKTVKLQDLAFLDKHLV